jgi:hypothetical protein
MATEPNPDEQPVTRLTEMEVVEVSLVDRAANKRRFLVVKRSKGMAKKKGTAANPQTENDDADLAGDAGDAAGDDADESGGGDAGDDAAAASGAAGGDGGGSAGAAAAAAAASSEAAGAGTATPVAGEAVDTATLTKAVVDMTEAVQELAQLVDNVSQRVDNVEKAATKKPASAPKARQDEDEDEDEDEELEDDEAPPPPRQRARKANPVTQKLTKVRTTLGIKPPGHRTDDALAAISKTLEGLRSDLGTIKSGLADQKSRVSRLEKQTGLPSSIPSDGTTKAKPRKVSWPLDLNAPMDRDSVNKDVSFHE